MPKYLFPYRFPRYHLIQSRSYSVPISAADRTYNAPVSSAEQTAEIIPGKDFACISSNFYINSKFWKLTVLPDQRKPDERPISPEEDTEEIIPSSKPPGRISDNYPRYFISNPF